MSLSVMAQPPEVTPINARTRLHERRRLPGYENGCVIAPQVRPAQMLVLVFIANSCLSCLLYKAACEMRATVHQQTCWRNIVGDGAALACRSDMLIVFTVHATPTPSSRSSASNRHGNT